MSDKPRDPEANEATAIGESVPEARDATQPPTWFARAGDRDRIPESPTQDRLNQWARALLAHEQRLEAAQATLDSQHEELNTRRGSLEKRSEELEKKARELDARAALLTEKDRALCEREQQFVLEKKAYGEELTHQSDELEEKRHKLLEIARNLKEQRRKLAAIDAQTGTDAPDATTTELRQKLKELQRQLQVQSFERELVDDQLRDARAERDSLCDRMQELESQRLASVKAAERKGRILMPDDTADPFSSVPQHMDACDSVPTRNYPVLWRTRKTGIGAKMKSRLELLWDFITNPGVPPSSEPKS